MARQIPSQRSQRLYKTKRGLRVATILARKTNMKRYLLAIGSCLLLIALLPGAALAGTFYVDQQNTVTNNQDQSADPYAQTFTAGAYGPLEYIELYMDNATNVNVGVALYSTTNQNAATAIPHASIDMVAQYVTTGPGEWVRFNFANDILLPRHVYAIVIEPSSLAGLCGSTANDYTRGRALNFYNGAWMPERTVVPGGPQDWSFKTEMGAASPTPTPRLAPTHAPTATPIATSTPTATATPTPTASPSTSTPASLAASSSIASAAPAGSSSSDGSGSADSSVGLMLPILGGIIVILAVGAAAVWLWRRRRSPAPFLESNGPGGQGAGAASGPGSGTAAGPSSGSAGSAE